MYSHKRTNINIIYKYFYILKKYNLIEKIVYFKENNVYNKTTDRLTDWRTAKQYGFVLDLCARNPQKTITFNLLVSTKPKMLFFLFNCIGNPHDVKGGSG